nr:ATP synthase F0 subunit 8 [Typhoptera quadrituberculata]
MSPLSWMTLFLMFSTLLILLTLCNYMSTLIHPKKTSLKSTTLLHQPWSKTSSSMLNWKW